MSRQMRNQLILILTVKLKKKQENLKWIIKTMNRSRNNRWWKKTRIVKKIFQREKMMKTTPILIRKKERKRKLKRSMGREK